MSCMKQRMNRAARLYFTMPWEFRLRWQQWSFALHIANSNCKWPRIVTQWDPLISIDPFAPFEAHRGRGRPRKRWDDELAHVVYRVFGTRHWFCELQDYEPRLYRDLSDACVASCHIESSTSSTGSPNSFLSASVYGPGFRA